MWLYLGIFFIIVFVYYSTKNSQRDVKVLFSVLFFLSLFVGLSDMLGGYDRFIYSEVFDHIADLDGDYVKNGAFNLFIGEFGWTSLNILISFVTKNRYIFILIVTLITYSLIFISFKRFLTNYTYGLILFMGLWFFFTFTYLRQVLATSIIWFSLPYILKRNFKLYALFVFLAFSIHNSAIICILLYFIPIKKYDRKIVIIVMSIIAIIGITGGPSALFDTYASISNDAMLRIEHNGISEDAGIRFVYFFEVAFFLYIILSNYHVFENNKEKLLMLNTSFVFCATLLFFIRSINGGRLSWYFLIGLISTLTYIVHSKWIKQSLVHLLIIVSFFLYLRVYRSWQVYGILYPYKTFFTPGHQTKQEYYDLFEYDANYDKNKFYR